MNMEFRRKLPGPEEVIQMYPVSEESKRQKAKNDEEIRKIFTGESDKLLLVIGPCSADREDAVLDYISRLRPLQEKVQDKIVIVPRIYTNKPRTTGIGYKGMLHQPDPEGNEDMLKGIIAIRETYIRAMEETGFFCADELLYPENYYYLSDILSYAAIGARSVEDQQHRLIASGLDVPVGMKNPTSGDLSVMMNSIMAAQHPHTFLFAQWEVHSKGNPLAHAILRGGVDGAGADVPNFHYETVMRVAELYAGAKLQNPAIIIDCNHSNSAKQCRQQIRIAQEVMQNRRFGSDFKKLVKGFMIESFLVEGSQPTGEVFGKSITDPCLGWEDTQRLILDIAESV